MKRLKGGKPRRFTDHRKAEARPYNDAYAMIAARYTPPDRLACELIGIAADLFVDYKALRQSKRAKASARRKTAGLFLGALRAAREGVNGQAPEGDPLAAVRAAVARATARAEAERAAKPAPADFPDSAHIQIAPPGEIAAPRGAERPSA